MIRQCSDSLLGLCILEVVQPVLSFTSVFWSFDYMDHYVQKHHHFLNTVMFVCMLFLGSLEFVVSQTGDCILDISISAKVNSSDCLASGTWGGFLRRNCCEAAFDGYLLGLAKRANRTGHIFLNSYEQKNCLISMKAFENDIMSCGIEKLTRGAGECSEYSVQDVKSELGVELRDMAADCKLSRSGSCSNCLNRWAQMDEVPNLIGIPKQDQIDVCRFAVLVTLLSTRVDDQTWFDSVHGCLAQQNVSTVQGDSSNGGNSFNTGLWLTVGGLTGIFMMLVIALWILLRRTATSKQPKVKYVSDSSLSEESNDLKVPIKEIYAATDNLSTMNYIGEGIAGKVYKGTLSNGQDVAVKHIVNDLHIETFLREVTSLSRIKHPNLVALIGYCEKDDECFLVYELCRKGNLSEWLYGKDKEVLSWNRRLEIAVDCARGLWFLHTYPEGCIVHRDIKPTNILLNENFQAKLSDFGLSKVMDLGQSFVSSEVRGTFGYVDPEYQKNRQVNSSGDVYSFGIVLLQILSAQRVINLNLRRPMPLDKMAKHVTRGGNITQFADPKLRGEYNAEAFDMALKLALSCTGIKQQRPSMEQVVQRLEKAHDMSAEDSSETDSMSMS